MAEGALFYRHSEIRRRASLVNPYAARLVLPAFMRAVGDPIADAGEKNHLHLR